MIWEIREFFVGISNFWKFRKEVYRYRSYEYEGSLDLLSRGLWLLAEDMRENDTSVCKEDNINDILKAVYCLRCLTKRTLVAEIQEKCCENVTEDQVEQEALKNLCRILKEGDKGNGGVRHWWT